MMITFNILTIFPEIFAPIESGIIGRAAKKGIIAINTINIRDFALDKHHNTDDYPYGGGTGMLMTVQPVLDAWRSINNPGHTIYLSPKGKKLDQNMCIKLAEFENITFICGRYEGIDERIIDSIVDEEISLGDYVLTGGEMAAMVVTDTVARMLPGVLGNECGFSDESHFNGLLEYPQYTRPEVFEDLIVPRVLLSGNHALIEQYRHVKSLAVTYERRPDMLLKRGISKEEADLLICEFPRKNNDIIKYIKG